MNLTVRQLRAFLHVARTGSFTRAAERAHMSQAGLSILIREVESQLGARLFNRTTRAVHLTEAGERFSHVAESVLRQLEDVATEVGAIGTQARRQLRVAATPLVCAHLVPQMLARFRDEHPDVRLSLVDGNLASVHQLVESGAVDVGLGFFFKVESGLVRKHLADFALMKVSRADIPCTSVGRASWSSLQSAPLITLPADNPIQRAIDQQLDKVGIGHEGSATVSFFATQIAMVEAGFGTAVMPTFAVAACRGRQLRLDVLGSPQLKLGFYRITRRGTADSAPLQAFHDVLTQQLPSMSR